MAGNDYVVFEDANGNEISNDPRWLAERTLRNAGVEPGKDTSEIESQLADAEAEIAALREALSAKALEESLEEDDETGEVDPDTDANGARTYSDVKGKDLVALARERGIELSREGKKLTASEVRAELIAGDNT